MNLIDTNILLYAEDSSSSHHEDVRSAWDDLLSSGQRVALSWPVLQGFIRIATNVRIFRQPLCAGDALDIVNRWLKQPNVHLIQETRGHWSRLERLIQETQVVGNLVHDAHLAALAMEHHAVLWSTDRDFARFPGLQWHNPLDL
ncbi:MAG: TA system VapC family ribonuclease toxin [Opitutales bacterium]